VRSAYIDGPTAEAIAGRARALRELAGTITGHAAGETRTDERPARSVLADVAAVFTPGEAQHLGSPHRDHGGADRRFPWSS
jgi:S-DNA-T family DNA segregation ATPase FtsK/SpoIIIE